MTMDPLRGRSEYRVQREHMLFTSSHPATFTSIRYFLRTRIVSVSLNLAKMTITL